MHRFTLLKPGAKPKRNSGVVSPPEATSGSNPLEIFFSSGSFVSKCDLCAKGFGWKPMLECDDCGLRFEFTALEYRWCTNHIHRTHGKCGEVAPTRMWYRPTSSRFSTQCHITISRVKQNAANASEGGKPKSSR
jgi:LIM domain kinase 1